MIDFSVKNDLLLLEYQADKSNDWVIEKLKYSGKVTLKKTFSFSKDDLLTPDPETLSTLEIDYNKPFEFILGRLEDEYFKIDGKKLSTKISLFIHKDIEFSIDFFVATKNISIFKKIDKLISEDVYIGGKNSNTLSEKDFKNLLKQFPKPYEIEKYILARITSVLINHFNSASDGVIKYNNYMNKKISEKGINLLEQFKEGELIKYETILQKLEDMLKSEVSYTEKQWQKEILQVILLLYPKYILAFEEVTVRDTYNNKNKRLDFLLVDSSGNVDIIEIKKPFDTCILTYQNYRGNFIPLRELSGTIMQIEKYIFYLNKWGKKGEDILTEKYKEELPDNFKIKITNPSGIIIMGRDNNLSSVQKEDFEVIRRKYNNIIDIITYDDLLRRLKFIVEQFKSQVKKKVLGKS